MKMGPKTRDRLFIFVGFFFFFSPFPYLENPPCSSPFSQSGCGEDSDKDSNKDSNKNSNKNSNTEKLGACAGHLFTCKLSGGETEQRTMDKPKINKEGPLVDLMLVSSFPLILSSTRRVHGTMLRSRAVNAQENGKNYSLPVLLARSTPWLLPRCRDRPAWKRGKGASLLLGAATCSESVL